MCRKVAIMLLVGLLGIFIGAGECINLRWQNSPAQFNMEVDQDKRVEQNSAPVYNVQIINNNFGSFMGWNQRHDRSEKGNFEFTHLREPSARDPPPPGETAKMARYIVQTSNWTSIATISTREPTVGFPCASVFAVSDGPTGKSTGVPYMYVTAMDLSVRDLKKNPMTSLTMTLAQSDYCVNNKLDPEDPRCAHIILTGKFVKLANGSDEEAFAKSALFTKHPEMTTWPPDHGFFFAKVDIRNILVLDNFGGANSVPVKEYYKTAMY